MNKQTLRNTYRDRLKTIADTVGGILASMQVVEEEYALRLARFEVQVGAQLASVRATFTACKADGLNPSSLAGVTTDDWRQHVVTLVPGRDVKTLYRWANAGAVATVLGEAAGNALVGAYVPLYRVLADAKTEEDRTAAEDIVRDVWAECVKAAGEKPPTADAVLAAAEAVSPTKRKGGSSGTTTASAEGSQDDKRDDEQDDGTAERGSSDTVVVLETAKLEAATGPVASIRKQLTDSLVGKILTEEGLLDIMLKTCRLTGEHGAAVAVVLAAPRPGASA